MSDALQAAWDAAVAVCCNGHDDCSFGGMSIPCAYWLAADSCPLNHGETCAWCPAAAVTSFRGRVHDSPLGALYSVPACQDHADQWVAANPAWARERPKVSEKSAAEVLAEWRAGLSPGERLAADLMDRAMDDALLSGVVGDEVMEPGALGEFVQSILNPPTRDGPPWTHTFAWAQAESLHDRVVAEGRRVEAEEVARAHRWAWSGPSRFERRVQRKVLRAFGVSAEAIGVVPRSAFSSAYRQRQRNRVKRRRR